MELLKDLFKLLDRRPFRPFYINLLNGERIFVADPDNIVISPSRARVVVIAVTQPNGIDYDIITPDGINALHVAGTAEAAAPTDEGGRGA